MKLINKIKNMVAPVLVAAVLFASCNKAPEAPLPNQIPANPASGSSLNTLLSGNPDDSLFNRLVIRASTAPAVAVANNSGVPAGVTFTSLLSNGLTRFTLFVPNNAAMRNFVNAASGGVVPVAAPDANHSAFISNNLPAANALAIFRYNLLPQSVFSTTITSTFSNFGYPTSFNVSETSSGPLTPPSTTNFSPFARLSIYPSKRINGAWLNNIPLVPGIDVAAANGVIHHTAAVAVPPSTFLWSRINTDPDMTYLRAAILRADSGTTQTPGTLNAANLQSVLSNFGPNLTVFAPTDAAFKATLYFAIYPAVYNLIYQQAYNAAILGMATPAQAAVIATNAANANAPAQTTALVSTPAVFSNPLLYGGLTAQTVKGIVVYHLLGDRAFSVNCPTTTTSVKTLLNSAIPTHPGIGITATFTGPSVSGLTVKGVGNASAFPVTINPMPNPNGASDQHFVNGVLHKLNGVLLPQ